MQHAATAIRQRRASSQIAAGAALLLLLTLLAYIPAMRAGYVGDDVEYVTDNPTLRSVDGLLDIWITPRATPQYYPLAFTTFWIEYQLWGLVPAGYHVTNCVLHATNALLLWLLLWRLRVPGAWFAAAIFALHPVHVESVAWITERKDVLSGLFSLLAVLVWVRFSETRRWQHYALVALCFTAALLSKTMILTLPLLILLLEWWRDPRHVRDRLRWILPLLLLSLCAIGVTTWRENVVDRSDMVMRALSPLDRVLIAGRAFWFYLSKMLWPAPLMTHYPRWHIDAHAAWQYIFPLSAGALLVALYYRRARLGRGPFAALAFFVIGLGPVLGLVSFNFMTFAYVADHFQYLASIGPIVLGAAAMTLAARPPRVPPALAAALAAALLGTLGLLTFCQAGTYKDVETQMRDCLAKNPEAAGAHYNLGTVLLQRGDVEEAIPHFIAALRSKPDYADAHNNLGIALWKQQKLDEAIPHFVVAAQLQAFDYKPEHNLALVLALQGHDEDAVQHYEASLRRNPARADVRSDFGMLLLKRRQPGAAAAQFAAAVDLRPDDAQARRHWAQALEADGQIGAAMEQYALVLQAQPADFALQSALATYLLQHGRLEESLGHFATAAQLEPDHADVYNNWGAALGSLGRTAEAIAQFTEAVRINPDDADVQANLQQALAKQGTPVPDQPAK